MSLPGGRGEADVVVKLGGSLLSEPAELTRAIAALERGIAGRADRLRAIVVPGGGPFADSVRSLDSRVGPDDDTAHWMAILGMTQYGHLLAERLTRGVLVDDLAGIRQAIAGGGLPVLAPYEWLRATDPLPHRWDVTSDSIAGWVARELHAPDLLLVKRVRGSVEQLADTHLLLLLQESAAHGNVVRARTVTPSDLEGTLLARRGAPCEGVRPARG